MHLQNVLAGKSRGSVTAEFAVIMPVVVVIIGIILSVFAAVSTTIRCQNTANHIAQQLVAKKYDTGSTFGVDIASLVHSGVSNDAVWDVSEGSPYVKVRIRSNISIGPVQIIPISVSGEALGYIV
jgi:uncharacterized protein (UPF0333 family)